MFILNGVIVIELYFTHKNVFTLFHIRICACVLTRPSQVTKTYVPEEWMPAIGYFGHCILIAEKIAICVGYMVCGLNRFNNTFKSCQGEMVSILASTLDWFNTLIPLTKFI